MSTGDFIGLWLHVLGLVAYGGATLALVLMVLPAATAEADPAARRAFLARALKVYDPLAIAALGVVVMTGASNLTSYKAALRGEFFQRVGWLLVWKLVLAFVVIMIGAIGVKNTMMPTGFSSGTATGWEFDFALLAANFAILLVGPGSFAFPRPRQLPVIEPNQPSSS